MKLINIPNIITCCNVLCGCMAIFFGFQGELGLACIFIIAGAVFDFFDGMTARALHISSPVGKELDSLADMVSFGIAPSILAYQITRSVYGPEPNYLDFFLAMLMAAFSALRLAKFNCDERQSLSFIGLPTPANALFWIGMTYVVKIEAVQTFLSSMNPELFGALWLVLVLALSIMLICELPMFSLKIKPGHMGWAENKLRYTFLVLTVAIIVGAVVIGQAAASLAFIILLYIIMSIIGAITSR